MYFGVILGLNTFPTFYQLCHLNTVFYLPKPQFGDSNITHCMVVVGEII